MKLDTVNSDRYSKSQFKDKIVSLILNVLSFELSVFEASEEMMKALQNIGLECLCQSWRYKYMLIFGRESYLRHRVIHQFYDFGTP